MVWWSWLLTAAGASGLWVAGNHARVGWSISLFVVQPLWVAYAIATRQWGFLASVAIYGSVFARNLSRASK